MDGGAVDGPLIIYWVTMTIREKLVLVLMFCVVIPMALQRLLIA